MTRLHSEDLINSSFREIHAWTAWAHKDNYWIPLEISPWVSFHSKDWEITESLEWEEDFSPAQSEFFHCESPSEYISVKNRRANRASLTVSLEQIRIDWDICESKSRIKFSFVLSKMLLLKENLRSNLRTLNANKKFTQTGFSNVTL